MLDYFFNHEKYIAKKVEEIEEEQRKIERAAEEAEKRYEEELNWRKGLQSIVSKEQNELMSKSDLTVIAENFFFNRFKVFNDSIKIIVKTTMPDVFFDRLKLSEECLGIMVNIQKYIEIGSPMHAIFEAEKIRRSSLINNFIDRCWDLTCEKASKLKTEKAQDRKFNEFYSMMEQYKSNFSDENIQHLKSKMREFLQP